MKIETVGMFHTPADWKELQDWIERHSPSERAHIMTAAVMGWNLAVRLSQLEEEPSK